MFELVVARYNEDLSWLNKFSFSAKVYNKGNDIELPHIKLKNIGRESTTYLHHIIENYERLSEHTIFVQGNPYHHCVDLDRILPGLPDRLNSLPFFSIGCYALTHVIICQQQCQLEHLKVYPEDFHNAFFEVPLKKFRHAQGAQYIVHRDNILNKPKAFYKHIYDSCSWTRHEPWSIERCWPAIFDRDDKYKHKIKSFYV